LDDWLIGLNQEVLTTIPNPERVELERFQSLEYLVKNFFLEDE